MTQLLVILNLINYTKKIQYNRNLIKRTCMCNRHEKSEKKVQEWMKMKQNEARLLHRKQRKSLTINKYKFSGKVAVEENNSEVREHMVADGNEKNDVLEEQDTHKCTVFSSI